MNPVLCEIYASERHAGMYLYVAKSRGLEVVPEALLERFGRHRLAMTLALKPEKPLARVDIHKVIDAMDDPGYFLQMPPRLGEVEPSNA